MSVRNFRQLVPLYLACYALWLGLSALGLWLLFELRSTLFVLAIWLRANPWAVRAIDQFGIVMLGLLWLMGIILLEHYLRRGLEKQQLLRRAVRVGLFVAVALGLSYALRFLLA
jgi:hypothetical protein